MYLYCEVLATSKLVVIDDLPSFSGHKFPQKTANQAHTVPNTALHLSYAMLGLEMARLGSICAISHISSSDSIAGPSAGSGRDRVGGAGEVLVG